MVSAKLIPSLFHIPKPNYKLFLKMKNSLKYVGEFSILYLKSKNTKTLSKVLTKYGKKKESVSLNWHQDDMAYSSLSVVSSENKFL